MPLSRTFKNTIQARVRRDLSFRKELLREGVDCLLAGDVETGKTILRDYINATVGFSRLSRVTRIPPKSLMRMLGPNGNPRAQNIFDVVATLQRYEGVRLEVHSTRS
jgi:DNA-binding phage protein